MIVLEIRLTQTAVSELEQVLVSHPKPYMRERASALLKVSQGNYIKDVSQYGLLVKRDAHTVGKWIHRYQTEGIAGLYNRKGRGRKASFSPPQSTRSAGTVINDNSPQSDNPRL